MYIMHIVYAFIHMNKSSYSTYPKNFLYNRNKPESFSLVVRTSSYFSHLALILTLGTERFGIVLNIVPDTGAIVPSFCFYVFIVSSFAIFL